MVPSLNLSVVTMGSSTPRSERCVSGYDDAFTVSLAWNVISRAFLPPNEDTSPTTRKHARASSTRASATSSNASPRRASDHHDQSAGSRQQREPRSSDSGKLGHSKRGVHVESPIVGSCQCDCPYVNLPSLVITIYFSGSLSPSLFFFFFFSFSFSVNKMPIAFRQVVLDLTVSFDQELCLLTHHHDCTCCRYDLGFGRCFDVGAADLPPGGGADVSCDSLVYNSAWYPHHPFHTLSSLDLTKRVEVYTISDCCYKCIRTLRTTWLSFGSLRLVIAKSTFTLDLLQILLFGGV